MQLTPLQPNRNVSPFAGPAALVKTIGPQIAALLGGRGGGRPGSFSGKASSFEDLSDVKKILQDACYPSDV